MPTESVACPMCGWWRPLDYGENPDTFEKRIVRFDKVNPATAFLYRKQNLRGAGRGSHDAVIELLDRRTLAEMDEEYRNQVRQQCLRILEELDKGPSTKPHVLPPQPPPPPPKKAKAAPKPKEEPAPKKKAKVKKAKPKKTTAEKEVVLTQEEQEYNVYLEPRMKLITIIQDAKAKVPQAIVALKVRADEIKAYEESRKKTTKPKVPSATAPKTEKTAPAKRGRKKAAPEPLPKVSGEDLLKAIKQRLGGLMDEEHKAKSVRAVEDFLNAHDIDETVLSGVYDIQLAIEEYDAITREDLTPEDFAAEKQAAFNSIQEAIDSLELPEE